MCGCNADGPGDGGVPGSPPGGTTGGTGLCCACPASGTVDRDGHRNYYTTTGYAGSRPKTNKCSIDIVRTARAGTVTVSTAFHMTYINTATAAADGSTVTSAISTAMTNWTGGASAYKLKIEQPGCDPQELTIVFTSTTAASASAADVQVTVDGTSTGPSSVRNGTRMTFKLAGEGSSASWNMTHETGHTFGLPDEYSELTGVPIVPAPTTPGAPTITAPTPAPTTTYIGAPPQANVTITQQPWQPSPRTPGMYMFDNPTVMGKYGNTTYPAYLFYWIAIEVSAILAAEGSPSVVTII
ncbi:hypothetical protein [Litoreibacter arenae]|uniref:Uncharacterized protein n=1 Tax=Litoreibacter arenae DSM 19593 TaxID=1123360 RepID=S9QJQ6_9RHOB|nr:hypothetical protein [Litoreibacter arenae]EPX79828.1 hypothetical protein thalar_01164 [Litoreibacter arenae DSM 19593]